MSWVSDIDGFTIKGNFTLEIGFIRKATTITFWYQGKEITMLTMTDTQMAEVSLIIKDKSGNPATVDGIPAWASTDPLVADAIVDPDGMKANVLAKSSGVCQITVSADADLGAGVKPIIGFLDVHISGTATVIELIPGSIQEQP